jgi:dTDP-4-dehydrorhamnose reductase
MKIYIAGCGGMLGEAFYKQFRSDHELKCSDIDKNEPWLSYLDFRDFDAYRRDVETFFDADVLIHLGAHTDLEYCQLNETDTYLTNTLSVENAVYIANQMDIPLVYIGTAGIFDGEHQSYDDWDTPNPLNTYARAKYMGERFVVENAHRYLVCRAGWMMGAGPKKDKKFIQKIMTQIKNGAMELFIVSDKDGTPTYTHDFAKNVKMLLAEELWGVYNMVCKGQTSRLEVARELVSILEKDIYVHSVDSSFFSEEYFVARPSSERLVNTKLELRGLNIMRDWKVALKEYINDYY